MLKELERIFYVVVIILILFCLCQCTVGFAKEIIYTENGTTYVIGDSKFDEKAYKERLAIGSLLALGEIQRDHQTEMAQKMIEVQMRLQQASASNINVVSIASNTNKQKVKQENNNE